MSNKCKCNADKSMNSTQLKEILNKHEIRATPGMIEVLRIFYNETKPLTIERVVEALPIKKDQSTVYRTIQRFIDKGLLTSVLLSSKKTYYELANRKHHHHIVCTECEKIEDIPCSIIKNVSPKEYKFSSINAHSLELFGICNDCDK